ncbi:methyltransferase domain-containing protein [Cyclobacterium jeungdonense]|uniref:Methyltransferase domain-containing protein n=1 Tax=Cyclobacterium jeungdonense TaxID=708087 RepID=A0ABT8C5Z9_9BACT|nr:methyltransferase domain-containing protein [Cyclobacterium jeungdonense]MDN3687449.1 methyltransferase domain-containing protein [Cyclobacterium jeungdonense]
MKTKIPSKKDTTERTGKTMGPVKNLEYHLHPEWWKRIFNATYLKTDADVVEDESITRSEINLFHELLDIRDGNSLLDLACGQGRHLLELTNRGTYQLFGLDRSRYLTQRAKSLARKKGVSINFKEGDARKLPYANDSFDFVTILGNSFGYFETSEDDVKILKEVFRVLKPGGRLLMDVADGTFLRKHYTPRSWEWIDKKHFVCRERSLATDNERLISREVVTNTEKGVIVDQFYAERLYTRENLAELISKVGFKELAFHGNLEVESLRNQDLGMMANRFILTTTARKEWSPKRKKKDIKNVVVVMGDPGLKDVIKPDAIFDTDDFETIEKLKVGLSKLENFKFSYLNNHQTLISDLQKIRDKTDLVFNLCDEGFGNDAKKELHIPALLEMMNLPYTGSNPQTLAYCYDKSLIRGIATEIGVPVANAFVITAEENLFELNIPFPVIAKPNFGDSSFGITQKNVANSIEELADAILRIREQFGYDKPILVEEFLTGAEVSVGIIGNSDNYTILPIIEEDYSELPAGLPKICGYEAKWLTDSPYMQTLRSIRASLPLALEQELINHSLKLFQRLDCKDYCRFDWRLNSLDEPKMLEVNPNPGWCWDGHLAKMSSIGGMDYTQMLEGILNAADTRYHPINEPQLP